MAAAIRMGRSLWGLPPAVQQPEEPEGLVGSWAPGSLSNDS